MGLVILYFWLVVNLLLFCYNDFIYSLASRLEANVQHWESNIGGLLQSWLKANMHHWGSIIGRSLQIDMRQSRNVRTAPSADLFNPRSTNGQRWGSTISGPRHVNSWMWKQHVRWQNYSSENLVAAACSSLDFSGGSTFFIAQLAAAVPHASLLDSRRWYLVLRQSTNSDSSSLFVTRRLRRRRSATPLVRQWQLSQLFSFGVFSTYVSVIFGFWYYCIKDHFSILCLSNYIPIGV